MAFEEKPRRGSVGFEVKILFVSGLPILSPKRYMGGNGSLNRIQQEALCQPAGVVMMKWRL